LTGVKIGKTMLNYRSKRKRRSEKREEAAAAVCKMQGIIYSVAGIHTLSTSASAYRVFKSLVVQPGIFYWMGPKLSKKNFVFNFRVKYIRYVYISKISEFWCILTLTNDIFKERGLNQSSIPLPYWWRHCPIYIDKND